MLVNPLTIVRLKCSFHCYIFLEFSTIGLQSYEKYFVMPNFFAIFIIFPCPFSLGYKEAFDHEGILVSYRGIPDIRKSINKKAKANGCYRLNKEFRRLLPPGF